MGVENMSISMTRDRSRDPNLKGNGRKEMAERQTRRDLEKRIDEPEKEVSQRSRAEGTLLKVSRAIEHAGGMILIADSNGIIEFVNPRFTEVTHYTKAEILGTHMTSLWEQPPDEEKQMWERLGSGAVWRGEFRGKKKDGGTYWELASISAFPDDSGAVTHLVKIAEEISDRKDLEESLRRSEEKYRRISTAWQKVITKSTWRETSPLSMKPNAGCICGLTMN
jgi:PAS domain S-box-containing protein